VSHHSDLIDTTEMYLRTVYELEEEGIVPLRARIAERLKQSGPTVSQTVARMERDGLLTVEGDRHLELTPDGRHQAIAVMRKHRLAECLLVDVIGLAWEEVHIEACRWEHVMSEAVERRLLALLGNPQRCPHGNPIPGLGELGADGGEDSRSEDAAGLTTMKAAAQAGGARVVVRRISEQLQPDAQIMRLLRDAGLQPGRTVVVEPAGDGVRVSADGHSTGVDDLVASHVFVTTS
jgi:DtxR family Mn-dependent transcriptional regulator